MSLTRRLVAEFTGTAFLLAAIIGSGIAGDRLADSPGLALLINAVATGATLTALILALGPASGAHFNPMVSVADAWLGGITWTETAFYVGAQVLGGVVGAVLANVMFSRPVISISTTSRTGPGLWLAEVVATFGLIAVILGCVRARRTASSIALAVGAYITGAYFFTSSTSFANPAVTIARTLSDTFAGIAPASAAVFIPLQVIGGLGAVMLLRWLYPSIAQTADRIAVPRVEHEVAS